MPAQAQSPCSLAQSILREVAVSVAIERERRLRVDMTSQAGERPRAGHSALKDIQPALREKARPKKPGQSDARRRGPRIDLHYRGLLPVWVPDEVDPDESSKAGYRLHRLLHR